MIERGRDDLVAAMVTRFIRRAAGVAESPTAARSKDEIFPGRLPNPIQPQTGTAAAPPPPPPGGGGPNTEVEPGGEIDPNPTGTIEGAGDDAAIAAAVEVAQRGNRVAEHDRDDLQPVLAFGSNADFTAVRGTATIVSLSAEADTAEGTAPNLVQLYTRSNRYTDVRVAVRRSIGSVGLWLGCSYSGVDISGYLGLFNEAMEQVEIYKVTANVLALLQAAPALDYPGLLVFQRVGSALSLTVAGTGTTVNATDSTFGAGYVGFGASNAIAGDICTHIEVTAPQ